MSHPTPRSLGFKMPAEWAPHASTWTAWPHDDELWVGHLSGVRSEFAAFVNTIAAHEPVNLIVQDEESLKDAQSRLGSNVTYHVIAHNDLWLRDSGPIFVMRDDFVALTDWEFNGWGAKFNATLDNEMPTHIGSFLEAEPFDAAIVFEGGSIDVNGKGIALTTKQCLLSKERNPNLSEIEIQKQLYEFLGIDELIWLEDGLEGDHTDGHIDTIARFVDEKTVVVAVTSDLTDPNHAVMKRNVEILTKFRSNDGTKLTIVPLELPKNRLELEGERLPPTYANFYICNGAVLVPLYNDPNDDLALATLKPCFPNHKVIGLTARNLITGGGAFHCVTQQQPKGRIWRGEP